MSGLLAIETSGGAIDMEQLPDESAWQELQFNTRKAVQRPASTSRFWSSSAAFSGRGSRDT